MERYAELLDLARRERELVLEGRWEELPALAARRDALLRTLPEQAPEEARPELEEALRVVRQTSDAIGAVLDEVRRELASLRTHRRVAASYSATGASASFELSA